MNSSLSSTTPPTVTLAGWVPYHPSYFQASYKIEETQPQSTGKPSPPEKANKTATNPRKRKQAQVEGEESVVAPAPKRRTGWIQVDPSESRDGFRFRVSPVFTPETPAQGNAPLRRAKRGPKTRKTAPARVGTTPGPSSPRPPSVTGPSTEPAFCPASSTCTLPRRTEKGKGKGEIKEDHPLASQFQLVSARWDTESSAQSDSDCGSSSSGVESYMGRSPHGLLLRRSYGPGSENTTPEAEARTALAHSRSRRSYFEVVLNCD